ncbi:McrB family protein [Enterobacter kobei]|uniref:McrB family protein n=1 Tax=Enterobacter kobei TaxID=208224 RepID=A0AAW3XP04_9ENTR|nr:McrB family protein [Enterobacter kobei]KJM92944.1 ATP-binding protein [Enterobacter kobei]MBC6325732.1 McrB family protein [Enterobacter kobei]MCU2429866.1 McrB family protein [Enterobacter kobei]HCB1628447.1 McrB family protein [Enterobacter kobei]HCB1631766.1 McrB family protein [Enterobacter kobei]
MVQEHTDALSFFTLHTANNDTYSPKWGPSFRALRQQVQNERPNFSDETLYELWYNRSNGVASVKQGGMSINEFNGAIEELRELSRQMAKECTRANYQQVIGKLKALKDQKILKKVYWALCHRAFAVMYPEHISNIVNTDAFFRIYNYCNNRFKLGLSGEGDWFDLNMELKEALNQAIGSEIDSITLNMSLWHLYAHFILEKNDTLVTPDSTDDDEDDQDSEPHDLQLPKNRILYGPPGTGKTYKTIDIAVRACEPQAYARLDGKEESERRRELKKIYDRLMGENRIRFITFHQSFGYEEFIEGLRAETTDDGNVRYDIKPGIFKQICDDAAFGNAGALRTLDNALVQLQERLSEGESITLRTHNGNPFRVTYKSETAFGIFPEHSKKEDLGQGYNAYLKDIRAWYQDNNAEIHNVSYVRGILAYLIEKSEIPATPAQSTGGKRQNFVLIIDEINRGNISKIFGELITLIETSKRAGEAEELSVSLPYSGTSFSVPNNLYLVGTMNTADRSLTALDTALRRRFEFVPMLPDTSLLAGTTIKGIELERLLETLNARIQALYDSEHTLGHAFFMPVLQVKHDEDAAFDLLKRIMKNKILPLLEEYFYNDWQKIRLVLGDNQKEDDSLQFVSSINSEGNFLRLFGADATEDLQEAGISYHLSSESKPVWNDPLAYRQIYAPAAIRQESEE